MLLSSLRIFCQGALALEYKKCVVRSPFEAACATFRLLSRLLFTPPRTTVGAMVCEHAIEGRYDNKYSCQLTWSDVKLSRAATSVQNSINIVFFVFLWFLGRESIFPWTKTEITHVALSPDRDIKIKRRAAARTSRARRSCSEAV